MLKRTSIEPHPSATKASRADTQTTLAKYFVSTDKNSKKPEIVQITPEYLGIHMYSEEEIKDSVGIDKQYKEFWNSKATELCKDKRVRHKLKDKPAIQGAINTSWTLHKSDILRVEADEMLQHLSELYTDEVLFLTVSDTIEDNKKKVIETTETLCLVFHNADDTQEKEVSELMKELRKRQSALKKAIDRKSYELNQN